MTTYKPYGIKEVQELLRQAKGQGLSVWTRHQRQEGMGLDFQNWNKIREIDENNLTVTAERGVTLGELEDAVNRCGLHVAAMTEDLRTVTLGDFFAEQMPCLTVGYYNHPRFQVLGLEVLLPDGAVLQVAGKTVKNVTGYDMCRFYISNRETLALPMAFTLKLVSKEPVQVMLEAALEQENLLISLVAQIRKRRITPQVFVYWNAAAAKIVKQEGAAGHLMMSFCGNEAKVKRELEAISDLAEEMQIGLQLCTEPEQLWWSLKTLRSHTVWADGLKVPSLHCGVLLEELAAQKIGCWYSPLEGSLHLLPEDVDGVQYQALCNRAVELGGCGNWYYQYQYHFAPAGATAIWQKLKEKFDSENRLNPMEIGGAIEHDDKN